MKRSAQVTGNPWRRYRQVEVGYQGEWSSLSPKIQPVLVDAGFRRRSQETYLPRQALVKQTHQGPDGVKTVLRKGRENAVVTYQGKQTEAAEVIAAANLVADAYTLFLFGSSWLAEKAENPSLIGTRTLRGEKCDLVTCRIRPGLGDSEEEAIIAWISQNTGYLKRVQFSLNGLDSTRGADADVTYHDFITAPDGSVWPTRFVEMVRRPFVFKAHEWELTSLKLEGQTVR